jgi:HEAT repeat protein
MSHDRISSRGRAPATAEDELRAQLDASDLPTRRDAAVGLVEAADTGLDAATVAALIQRLRDDEDADVRQFAVEALGVAGGPSEAIETALEDDDPWVRAEAVVAYSRTKPGDAEALRTYLDDESGWVRRNAVIALGKVGAAEQSELIDRIGSDPHPPVREFAAQFLGEVADDRAEAVRILAAVLAREPNAFVRAKAAESLGELGTDRAEEALESQGLPDRSDAVQRAARRALASARGTDPEEIDLPDPPAPGGSPDTPEESPAGPQQAPTYDDLRGPR